MSWAKRGYHHNTDKISLSQFKWSSFFLPQMEFTNEVYDDSNDIGDTNSHAQVRNTTHALFLATGFLREIGLV